MSCPFCMIASGSPPASDPAILKSPVGSAYVVLSTPTVVAFLDIAPLTRGHVLLCPRAHRSKGTDMTMAEAAAIGVWLPVLGRSVLKALEQSTETGSWNVIQANGAAAGQTVPHSHFHIIPRSGTRHAGDITDAERKNLAIGEGPRIKLNDAEGTEVSKLIKSEIVSEIRRLTESGDLVDSGAGVILTKLPDRDLKL